MTPLVQAITRRGYSLQLGIQYLACRTMSGAFVSLHFTGITSLVIPSILESQFVVLTYCNLIRVIAYTQIWLPKNGIFSLVRVIWWWQSICIPDFGYSNSGEKQLVMLSTVTNGYIYKQLLSLLPTNIDTIWSYKERLLQGITLTCY